MNRISYRKIFGAIIAFLIISETVTAQYNTKIDILKGEKWWGVFIGGDQLMPLEEPFPKTDLSVWTKSNAIPFLVSSRGRYIWSKTPFKIEFTGEACLIDSPTEEVEAVTEGKTLREAYLVCYHKNFAPQENEDRTPADQVIVIHEKGYEMSEENVIASQMLENTGIPYRSFSYSILEGRDILNSLKDMMTLTAKNHLLVASESEAFVNDVVRNANLLVYEKYDLALYASSKIRGFETIEVENLHNANLHVSTSYYIDYDRKDVQDFLMKYRALFGTEPTPFAFQGYDITRYFIEVCSKYGNGWSAVLPMEDEEMLQSGFRFSRVKTGASEIGYTNTAVRRIVYGPDYSVTLSKGI